MYILNMYNYIYLLIYNYNFYVIVLGERASKKSGKQ